MNGKVLEEKEVCSAVKPVIISYYTVNTKYEEVMNTHLLPSLKKFDLEYQISGIDSLGNWQENTTYKATFICERLHNLHRDIIWLDADCIVQRYPTLLYEIQDIKDIAVFYLDWYKHWRSQEGQLKEELISATMLFRYRDNVLKTLEKWIEANEKNTNNVFEQKIFQDVLDINEFNLNIERLPAEYCAIIKHDGKLPNYINNPAIIQYQASRKYRYGR